jgi:uncharacterized lipoprotein YmbA
MTIRSPYVAVLFMLIIAGCGSSPPVHYFTLDTIELDYTQDQEGSPVMAVGPFRMPEYLNRSQMVRRGTGSEMIVDDLNRWAEPLDDAIHHIISTNVDTLLASVIVVSYPSSPMLPIDYRLVGRIGRFNSDKNGLVILEVQWGASEADADLLIAPRRNRYESQAADPADPGSIARGMSDVLAQFSREIASEFGTVIADQ